MHDTCISSNKCYDSGLKSEMSMSIDVTVIVLRMKHKAVYACHFFECFSYFFFVLFHPGTHTVVSVMLV